VLTDILGCSIVPPEATGSVVSISGILTAAIIGAPMCGFCDQVPTLLVIIASAQSRDTSVDRTFYVYAILCKDARYNTQESSFYSSPENFGPLQATASDCGVMFCQHPSSRDGAIAKYELKPRKEVRGERLRSININLSCPVAVVCRPLREAAPFVGSPIIRNLGDVPGEFALRFYVCLVPGEQAAAALQASQSAQRLASTDSSFVAQITRLRHPTLY
jgi:hypothetical protein